MTMNTETQNQTFARVAAKTGVALTLAVAMALPAVAANAETFKAQNRVTVTTQGDGVFYAPMAEARTFEALALFQKPDDGQRREKVGHGGGIFDAGVGNLHIAVKRTA